MTHLFQQKFLLQTALLFLGVPVLFYITSDIPQRDLFKETVSLMTLVTFCLMTGQLFLTKNTPSSWRDTSMRTIIRLHNILGYLCTLFLLIHPLLIVAPRLYEPGIGAGDAFITLITTLDNSGIVSGICSWLALLVLAITALLKRPLFTSHRVWRNLHGLLAIIFLAGGCWHAISLGRHMSPVFAKYCVASIIVGTLLLIGPKLPKLKTAATQEVTS